ncbi:hypothetical protein HRI_002497400 [Hibiscus trionum]|uniref:Uncharacterized protein n=1 Tax=Hibiscus trionum TaxID=183268 RepID=A0A9W7M5H1_HIBTR|nr:hypothetical protein HRI_002497400 [Hibiscus trionum]
MKVCFLLKFPLLLDGNLEVNRSSRSLDYDYTFTTPCGSEWLCLIRTRIFRIVIDDDFVVIVNWDQHGSEEISDESSGLHLEDCEEQLDVAVLTRKEPLIFYDEVIIYEDELSDNGESLLTVKVVIPSFWFFCYDFGFVLMEF